MKKNLLVFLFHFVHKYQTVQSSEFLSLLRTEKYDYCVTNSSYAMYYTTQDGSVFEDTALYPRSRSYCDKTLNMRNCINDNKDWKFVSSVDYDGLPVFDQRWKDLPTKRMRRLKRNEVGSLSFEYLRIFEKNPFNFRLPLSLRVTKADIFFCEKEVVSNSRCYWFILELNNEIVLRKCENQIPIIAGQINTCTAPEKSGKFSRSYTYLSKEKWRHIILEKQDKTFLLKHMNKGQEEIYFEYVDPDPYPIHYILLHTEDDEAFYKLHDYHYLRTTFLSSHKLLDKPIQVKKSKVCFLLYLTTCELCRITLYLEKKVQDQYQVLSEPTPLPPSFGVWKGHKILFSVRENIDKLYVRIKTDVIERRNNEFWAVDPFRECEEEEYQISTSTDLLKSCQLVNSDERVEWNKHNCIKQLTCQQSNVFGGSCIACNNQSRFGIECNRMHACERINKNENCYCPTDEPSTKDFAPFDLRVKWYANNTIQLFWDYPYLTNCQLTDIQIEITYTRNENGRNFTKMYTPEEPECMQHYKIHDIFPPATKIYILVSTRIGGQQQYINKTEYSYPAVPALVNPSISIIDRTNSTIRFFINITEKDEIITNVSKYSMIILRETNTNNKDENLRKLENVLNRRIKLTSYTRMVAEINLLKYKSEILEYIIGDDSSGRSDLLNQTIFNTPLQRGQLSEIIIIIINGYKKKYNFGLYSFNINRLAAKGSPENNEDKENSDGKTSYVLLFLLLAVLVMVAVVIILVRRRKANIYHSNSLAMIMNEFDEVQLPSNGEEVKKNSRKPSAAIISSNKTLKLSKATDYPNPPDKIHSKVIKLSDFKEYLKKSLEYKELERQHEIFPRGQTQSWEYGSLDGNKHKNRYFHLITYDHSRVKLEKISGEEYSDYINASYIHGYTAPKTYIATQGPKRETLGDFWRMIWQENVKYIVMIANIIEEGKENVHQYWPTKGESNFEGISVQIQSVQVFVDFEHRMFRVTRGYETRALEQIHFTGWPDQAIPLYCHTLRPFVQKILEIPLTPSSPVVVHCSAGVGRTGTILLIDICLRMAAEERQVDFLNVLQKLRQQRPNMVDNVEQYKLAHLVVLDHLMGLRTSIPCDKLDEKMEEFLSSEDHFRTQIDYLKDSGWQDEAMQSVGEPLEDQTIYSEKNRFRHIIPAKQRRIVLSKYPDDDASSVYINAVRVDGIKYREKFIVTQQPLPNTVGDFWRLILEMGSEIIISLNEINLEDETSCKFWPTSENPVFHPVNFIVVTFEKLATFRNYNVYSLNMDVKQKKKMKVKVFEFKGWQVKSNLPFSCEDFFNFWLEADFMSRQSQNVIITCFDGVTASGVFVALSHVIEKMRLEKECDVCSAVRNVRHNRQQFVTNLNQFIFLYESALIYNIRCFNNTD